MPPDFIIERYKTIHWLVKLNAVKYKVLQNSTFEFKQTNINKNLITL